MCDLIRAFQRRGLLDEPELYGVVDQMSHTSVEPLQSAMISVLRKALVQICHLSRCNLLSDDILCNEEIL